MKHRAVPDEPSLASMATELRAAARGWLADDPDEITRAELSALIERSESADAGVADAALADLADRFAGLLDFGTAGLRGAIGAGPNRMNRSVVIRAASGLTSFLRQSTDSPLVVVGYDARHRSADFARDTCAVVVAAGGRAIMLPRPLPTPVLAFAIRHFGADAGVMVTASHNPPQDNGYKVYLGDGSQIVPPTDAQIKAKIVAVRSVASVALADDGWQLADDAVVTAYIDAVASLVSERAPRTLRIVHTSLHGVGHEVVHAALAAAGFTDVHVVDSQAQPDPDFPTVSFPNPEEPGAIDAALALAAEVEADIVIANDPDADRCAVAVNDTRGTAGGGWRMLRGDELGALLGAHVIAGGVQLTDVLARSIVSSRQLAAMAAAAGCQSAETLTGFKWIARAPGLRYGYEEAIGYCVAPWLVADKDGISAALVAAEQAAWLKAEGRSLVDVLDDLAVQHGVYASDAFSVRVEALSQIDQLMSRLRGSELAEVASVPVTGVDDLAAGVDGLPPTEGLRYWFADGSRVIIRPSGTEPKLKVYLEAIVPVADRGALGDARGEAARRLANLRDGFATLTQLPG